MSGNNSASPFVPKRLSSGSSILKKFHPNVKVPQALSEKSNKEQIIRSVDRLKTSPKAVDTLYMSLKLLLKYPNNEKYRTIDKSTPGFQRSLAKVVGAEDMLRAVNFCPRGPNVLILNQTDYDPKLLHLAVNSLESTRATEEYIDAKRKIQFSREVQKIKIDCNNNKEELSKRAQYLAKCPPEPEYGRSALMQIVIAGSILKRRFNGDDTFEDVLSWLGGQHGSIIPEKIRAREWSIVDLNRYPLVPIDYDAKQNYTLQYIGWWPSGLMEIIPSTENSFNKGSHIDDKVGPSRGLACAEC